MPIHSRVAAGVVLMLISQALFALGLGTAEVRSYLNEPLNAHIRLISASQEELHTVTAQLASASDFERLGLTRTVSVPLHFQVNADASNAYVEVTSRLPINDPVVQLLLEVKWSGGRMLREFTLFIDPPTFAARAPAPRVDLGPPEAPAPAPPPAREAYPDPAQVDFIETVRPSAVERAQHADKAAGVAPEAVAERAQVAGDLSETVTEPVAEEPEVVAEPAQQTEAGRPSGEPESTADPGTESSDPEQALPEDQATNAQPASEALVDEAAPAPGVLPGPSAVAGEYGPVSRGQTLWGIASDYTRDTQYSVNQAMLAIQRLNPDAFGGNNINSLHRGAILRMPSMAEVGRLTQRQAMIEAMRQEQAYRALRAGLPFPEEPPLLADAALAVEPPESANVPAIADTVNAEQVRLELVPPSSGEPSSGGGDSEAVVQPTGAVSGTELEEVLARTEEELANAQQENAYLSERIRELERQIADAEAGVTVENQELAALESGLREGRANAAEAVVPDEPSEAQAWYQGKTPWLVLALVVVIGLGVWILRRMSGPGAGAVRGTGGEAGHLAADDRGPQPRDGAASSVGRSGQGQTPEAGADTRKAKPVDDSEAIELDTSDPETQLDLARAYLSMGDPEAARDMLQAVLEQGNEAQVAEARGMMKEL